MTLEDKGRYKNKYEYAWYVVDKKSKEKLKIKMYDLSPKYACNLNMLNTDYCYVRVFLLDKKANKKYSQIIADFYKDSNNKWNYKRELNIDPSLL